MLILRRRARRLTLLHLPTAAWLTPMLVAAVVFACATAWRDGGLGPVAAVAIVVASLAIAVVALGQSPIERLAIDLDGVGIVLTRRNLVTRRGPVLGPRTIDGLARVDAVASRDAANDPVARLAIGFVDGERWWFPDDGTTANYRRAVAAIAALTQRRADT